MSIIGLFTVFKRCIVAVVTHTHTHEDTQTDTLTHTHRQSHTYTHAHARTHTHTEHSSSVYTLGNNIRSSMHVCQKHSATAEETRN